MKENDSTNDRWFRDWFQNDYLTLYQHRDVEEARQFLDHIIPELTPLPNRRVLDLACGAGRHAGYLASMGYRVIGVDLSMPLLRRAVEDHCSDDVSWVQGDMRRVPLGDSSVSVVVNLFTSFGYFRDDGDNEVVLKEVARVLMDGGWFVLDTLNPGFVESTLVARSERTLDDLVIVEEREIDRQKNRVNKTIHLDREGQRKTFVESVRMYSVEELRQMLSVVGLVPRLLWGDYYGGDYELQSPRIIISSTFHG